MLSGQASGIELILISQAFQLLSPMRTDVATI